MCFTVMYCMDFAAAIDRMAINAADSSMFGTNLKWRCCNAVRVVRFVTSMEETGRLAPVLEECVPIEEKSSSLRLRNEAATCTVQDTRQSQMYTTLCAAKQNDNRLQNKTMINLSSLAQSPKTWAFHFPPHTSTCTNLDQTTDTPHHS